MRNLLVMNHMERTTMKLSCSHTKNHMAYALYLLWRCSYTRLDEVQICSEMRDLGCVHSPL